MNTDRKKWMVVLTEDQFEWVKDTAKEAGVKGMHVIREIINRQMRDRSDKFAQELAQAKTRIEKEKLLAKREALEEQIKELDRQDRHIKEKVTA